VPFHFRPAAQTLEVVRAATAFNSVVFERRIRHCAPSFTVPMKYQWVDQARSSLPHNCPHIVFPSTRYAVQFAWPRHGNDRPGRTLAMENKRLEVCTIFCEHTYRPKIVGGNGTYRS
jgi:hypothetical protein